MRILLDECVPWPMHRLLTGLPTQKGGVVVFPFGAKTTLLLAEQWTGLLCHYAAVCVPSPQLCAPSPAQAGKRPARTARQNSETSSS
jgi:hypothetical protein